MKEHNTPRYDQHNDPSMTINGTILGVAPMRATLLIAGLILTALFTLIRPEVSAGLGFFSRLTFWMLHIGSALISIALASYILRYWSLPRLPIFIVVSLTGILGALITTPVYYLIDQWYPGLEPEADDWTDLWEHWGWWQGMIAEFLEISPILLMSWYAVNLPLMFNKPQLNHEPLPGDPPRPTKSEDPEEARRQQLKNSLYESLPQVLGQDIVAISSDLHYLNVHTTLGRTLILGSLKHYAEAFGEEGLLVHRSHWVMKNHVIRVHIAGNDAYCAMSTGLKVPISRSKRKEVKEIFGQGIIKAKAPTQLKRVK